MSEYFLSLDLGNGDFRWEFSLLHSDLIQTRILKVVVSGNIPIEHSFVLAFKFL